jgi:outer membrane protein assembly factor BamA
LIDDKKYFIKNISYTGNKQTKIFIIERELSFQTGDTLTGAQLKERMKHSEENLLNTALFNFVTITPGLADSTQQEIEPLLVVVALKERWYTWPTPVFDVAEQNINVW